MMGLKFQALLGIEWTNEMGSMTMNFEVKIRLIR